MTTLNQPLEAQSLHKRKRNLHDYFTSNNTSSPLKIPRLTLTTTTKLPPSTLTPATAPHLPPGLTLIPNFITPTEESHLLHFLSSQPWRTDLSRRVLHYGGTYCLMPPRSATPLERKQIESQILTAPPIPSAISFVINRMISPAHNLYTARTAPQFCIVNEYTGSLGISAHVENFRFHEPVCALTLNDGDFMRFHELERADDGSVRSGKAQVAPRTGRKVDVWLPGRSLLVMRGEARGKWQHEIVRGRKRKEGWKRVSLTFRTDVKE